jgi:RHS repeat-associated protein
MTVLSSGLVRSDAKGTVLAASTQSMVYAAYGFREPIPAASALGFSGQLLDQGTGRYLLGNGQRTYNPVLMRFQSPDVLSPFGKGGLNAYAYCLGDPVNGQDPTGHAPLFGLKLPRAVKAFVKQTRAADQGRAGPLPGLPDLPADEWRSGLAMLRRKAESRQLKLKASDTDLLISAQYQSNPVEFLGQRATKGLQRYLGARQDYESFKSVIPPQMISRQAFPGVEYEIPINPLNLGMPESYQLQGLSMPQRSRAPSVASLPPGYDDLPSYDQALAANRTIRGTNF